MGHRFADLDRPGLDAGRLRDALSGTTGPCSRLVVVEETGSTNTDLVRYAATEPGQWPDLSVLTAEHQSAGRGRLERSWSAPPRSALSVSVLLRPHTPDGSPLPDSSLSWLSLLAAAALAGTLNEHARVPARIKWPNDVLIHGRKVAGILAQLVPAAAGTEGGVVVGAGLNVSVTGDELPGAAATSLLLEEAVTLDRNILLKAYLRSLAGLYRWFCAAHGDAEAPLGRGPSLHQTIATRMNTLGQRVRAELPGGGQLLGLATALAESGALQITDDAGRRHTVTAADVVHLRGADYDPAG